MKNSQPSTIDKAKRRLRAWDLFEQGWKQTDIARELQVSESAVSGWIQKAINHGPEALSEVGRPGRKARISPEQLFRLKEILGGFAYDWGYQNDKWSLENIQQLIKQEFGIQYSLARISSLLKEINWKRPSAREILSREVARIRARGETTWAEKAEKEMPSIGED